MCKSYAECDIFECSGINAFRDYVRPTRLNPKEMSLRRCLEAASLLETLSSRAKAENLYGPSTDVGGNLYGYHCGGWADRWPPL